MKLSCAILLVIVGLTLCVSSCRKYRVEHSGCKCSAFDEDGFGLPNIISSNQDGINDWLRFEHGTKEVSGFLLKIRSGGGIKIFETSDPDFKWEATNNGNRGRVAEDVYSYNLSFDYAGKNHKHKGQVTNYRMGDKNAMGEVCFRNYDKCVFGSQWNGNLFDKNLPSNEYFWACE